MTYSNKGSLPLYFLVILLLASIFYVFWAQNNDLDPLKLRLHELAKENEELRSKILIIKRTGYLPARTNFSIGGSLNKITLAMLYFKENETELKEIVKNLTRDYDVDVHFFCFKENPANFSIYVSIAKAVGLDFPPLKGTHVAILYKGNLIFTKLENLDKEFLGFCINYLRQR